MRGPCLIATALDGRREELVMERVRPCTLSQLMIAAAFALSQSPAQAQDLRIGFLAPMTGIFAQLGTDKVNGFRMYLEEHRGQLGGAKVNFIVEDTQGKPDTAVTKANKLILQDRVDMLVGGVLATTGYALAPVSTREKMLYIGSIATADDLGQRDFEKYPYMVRPTFVPSQPSHPLGQWACEQGYKRVAAIAADYAFGHETLGGFQKAFEDCGGQIVQKIWPPIGTKDFGPYIPSINSDIDAIFALMVGPMSLQFPKQLRGAGFTKPILGGGTNYDEFILPSMGEEALGGVSAFMYSAALDTPKNRDFVTKYRSKYGKVPSYYSEANYTAAQWIDETLKKAGGKYPGPLEFIKIMQSIKLDAVRGPVSLDDRLTAINNIYIKKVERKKMFGYDKEELWNTVIKTYPNVSQFWTYDKEAFLKQPVYSRDFPPCRFCQ
jgi:branched-chain amino acid transport system substrate-binding protein